MSLKTCNRCGRELPTSEFYAQSSNKDGLFHQCKSCVRAANLARYHEAPSPREPARNPKHAARSKLKYAVRTGAVTPSPTCEDCGHDFSVRARQAHHADYSKPLEVAWLCSRCHGARHAWKGKAFLRRVGARIA